MKKRPAGKPSRGRRRHRRRRPRRRLGRE